MGKKRIGKSVYLKWYEDMLFWRKFEDKAAALYIQQKIRGFFIYITDKPSWQAVYSPWKRRPDDRGLQKPRSADRFGRRLKRIVAELMGKATGTSGGRGGSMHMFLEEHNFFGGHGIVGGLDTLGAGLAFADRYLKNKSL